MKNQKGAIVVEATISLSVFIFAIFTILSIVNIYARNDRVSSACYAMNAIEAQARSNGYEILSAQFFTKDSITGNADFPEKVDTIWKRLAQIADNAEKKPKKVICILYSDLSEVAESSSLVRMNTLTYFMSTIYPVLAMWSKAYPKAIKYIWQEKTNAETK